MFDLNLKLDLYVSVEFMAGASIKWGRDVHTRCRLLIRLWVGLLSKHWSLSGSINGLPWDCNVPYPSKKYITLSVRTVDQTFKEKNIFNA